MVGTLAIGQTLIILTAGIDLSCGTAMALGSIVMTKLAVDSDVPPVLAILLGIATCMIVGFVNGGLVVGLAMPPFIVTLGTFSICLALTHIYSKDETISNLPSAMTKLGESFKIGGTAITYGSLVTLALFALVVVRARPRRPGAGACTRWATTRRRRASWASRCASSC